MITEAGKKYLTDYSGETQEILESFLNEKSKEASSIGPMALEVLKRFRTIAIGGKRLRGGLFCLGYEAAGGTVTDEILKASLSVELFQTGGLVQDDIVDQDERRRGVSSLHVQLQPLATNKNLRFGESLSIFMGDVAMFWAYDLLALSGQPAKNIQQTIHAFSLYAQTTCLGQMMDIDISGKLDASEKDILSVMRNKTAIYTGVMPLVLGAKLAGCVDRKQLKAMESYGLSLGSAFQIQDDILGTFGDESVTGKPVGNDLREGKMTLLICHLFNNGNQRQKELLKQCFAHQPVSQDQILQVQNAFRSTGSYDYVLSLAKKYVSEGLKEVPAITSQKRLQEILSSLLSYMLGRIK